MPTAYIMRGMPGCGKSTFAKTLGCPTFSADDYHIDRKTGEYNYNPSNTARAHQWCLSRFIAELRKKTGRVVVDNTGIHVWEISSYIQAALLAGYDVQIHEWHPQTLSTVKLCCKRNVHNVPIPVMLQMWYEMESVDLSMFDGHIAVFPHILE